MPAVKYLLTPDFIQYTGTNGAEVAAYMGAHVVTDTGAELKVSFEPNNEVAYTFAVGDWYSIRMGFWAGHDFNHQYASVASMTPGTDKVGTMDGVSVSVPVLLLGASVDRPVVWNTAFPDTSYKVRFLPDANTIGRITPVVKAGTKTVNGLTVTISAGLALTVAGVLHVLGTT